jgi:hypothetical protein
MAKVYAIRNRTSEQVYIGTTTKRYLSDRMSGHRYAYRKELAGDTSRPCRSHLILSCPTAYINLVEDLGDCDKATRKARERWWIENTPNCVNKQLPGRDVAEYYRDHREEIIAYQTNRKRQMRSLNR